MTFQGNLDRHRGQRQGGRGVAPLTFEDAAELDLEPTAELPSGQEAGEAGRPGGVKKIGDGTSPGELTTDPRRARAARLKEPGPPLDQDSGGGFTATSQRFAYTSEAD